MRLSLLIVLMCGATAAALAHDPGLSATDLRFKGDQLLAHVTFARREIEPLLPRSDFLEVKVDGLPVVARQTSTQFNNSNALEIWMRFPLPAGRCVAIRSPLLGDLAFGHRQYLAVLNSNGGVFTQQMLSASNDRVELSLAAVQPAALPFRKFLVLGVEQMLTGYDHLVFLFGLLLMCGTFRSATKIITAFTVAYSITLALATYNIVSFPSRIVEPMIAVSIGYVGVENIWPHNLDKRWLFTFGFGLIHGLGFASVLRDLGIGANGSGAVIPLLSFNLGIELGQISIAAIVLPIVWSLRRQPLFVARWVPACSVVVALLGSYWFIQRTLF
jgi:hydrogenase/urease accessory protein HupE